MLRDFFQTDMEPRHTLRMEWVAAAPVIPQVERFKVGLGLGGRRSWDGASPILIIRIPTRGCPFSNLALGAF